MTKLETLWHQDKLVLRTIIFRLVLEIDPNFKVNGGIGGKGSEGHLHRLKNWFYFGFKRQFNLSNRKIASIGQKLPNNWEVDLRNLQQHVVVAQFPQTIELWSGESVNVPGTYDDDWYNFDHVPVWQKPVASTCRGPKDSGCRNVKTAEREKNRYTVVLTISKSGRKLPVFIIFKGVCICLSQLASIERSQLFYLLITGAPVKQVQKVWQFSFYHA